MFTVLSVKLKKARAKGFDGQPVTPTSSKFVQKALRVDLKLQGLGLCTSQKASFSFLFEDTPECTDGQPEMDKKGFTESKALFGSRP
jgi:hypothetical protein